MKILIDPMLAILARDLLDSEKAEILMCILDYPSRDCDISLWKYMRQQIDMDAQKYREKCERMAENGRKRWLRGSDTTNSNSEVSKENVSKPNINKDNCNVSVSSMSPSPVDNLVDSFLINQFFSINAACNVNHKLKMDLALYLPIVLERAEKTLKKKRDGQHLSSGQIVEWVELERGYYAQNQRNKK